MRPLKALPIALLIAIICVTALQAQSTPPNASRAVPAAPAAPAAKTACCRQRTAEDFHPMTRTERTSLYLHSLIGPRALVFTAVRAGWNQALDSPEEWDSGAKGFGYRAASAWGQSAISNTFESGLALAFDEDNRYFASGEHGVWRRLKYAVLSSFLARHDNGTRSLSISALAGPAAGAALSRTWQPDSTRSAGDAAESFGVSIGVSVGVNVAREFLPSALQKLLP
jgi:hypothetical protein